MIRKLLARLGRFLDLARILDLPPWDPERMIAAQVVLYVGVAIIIAATLYFRLARLRASASLP